ncbi:hypothetical protein FKP32DRAFT_22983 [Trametes sanguinea]|nr:hypothetical protein FKP32DRAFT_22983 [Trametes sanguinea]
MYGRLCRLLVTWVSPRLVSSLRSTFREARGDFVRERLAGAGLLRGSSGPRLVLRRGFHFRSARVRSFVRSFVRSRRGDGDGVVLDFRRSARTGRRVLVSQKTRVWVGALPAGDVSHTATGWRGTTGIYCTCERCVQAGSCTNGCPTPTGSPLRAWTRSDGCRRNGYASNIARLAALPG